MCFFFQAEDGIRDTSVTGVQTCALPILERFYTHIAEGQDKAAALRHAKIDLLAKYGRQVPPYYWGAFILVGDGGSPKIGRASCRERVEIWVAAVAVNGKEREHRR